MLLAGNNANGVYPLKYFKGKFDAYQRTYVIRSTDAEKLDNRYLYFALRLKLELLRSISTGAATKFLTLKILDDIRLELPPIKVQRRIASILSAYDDLIENNTRRIKILEEMATMIYREWFVNFRFPGHEKFKMVESDIGAIPEGWKVRRLGELLTLDKGVSYSGAGLTKDGIPMVNLKNIRPGGGFRRDATKPYSGDFKPRHTVKAGDVVVANTDLTQAGNVVASPALIPRLGNGTPILISHHLYAVRCLLNISSLFFYHLMLHENFRGFAKGFAVGTTVLGLPRKAILDFTFACPPESQIKSFAVQVSPLHELVETLNQQSDNLSRTRNLLLPKLVCVEIDVEHSDRDAIAQSV